MHGYLQLVSQDNFTALSLSDLKSHLRVTGSQDDSYINSLLQAAVAYCERTTALDLRNTTWKLVRDQFPVWGAFNWTDRYGNLQYVYPTVAEYAIGRMTQKWQEIPLMRGPLQSVQSVQYFDGTNALTTIASDQYRYATYAYQPSALEPVQYWPIAYPRPDAVQIIFSTSLLAPTGSGSGEAGNVIPASILHAIRLLVGSWFMMREDQAYGPQTIHQAVGTTVECLLSQFSSNTGVG